MRHLMKPLPAAMISGSGLVLTKKSRRPLRLDAGQTQQTRRIKMLVTKSPTAVGYTALAEHGQSLDTGAGPTREPTPGRTQTKGHGMAPLDVIVAAHTTMAANPGIRGHHPTI